MYLLFFGGAIFYVDSFICQTRSRQPFAVVDRRLAASALDAPPFLDVR